jgi:hypothetical protein
MNGFGDFMVPMPEKREFLELLLKPLRLFSRNLLGACRDLVPIIVVITFFQWVILQKPFPDVLNVLVGLALVILGLALFVLGLEIGLFPIGESMGEALAFKGSLFWLLVFGFALGFSTTIAEPALIAVTKQAALVVAQGGFIDPGPESMEAYALGFRLTVAVSVGAAILLGLLRILRGWPLHFIIIGGYVVVMAMTACAPKEIIGIAYDAGGVTTSTVTVPLVTALGVGLASTIRGRNPLVDGFGLIALASLLPMIFVMAFGMIFFA